VDPLLSRKIQTKLLRWFEKKGRDLPWRKTGDPYAIWISEIMLQQTQVATVIPYYQRFLKSFPTVHHLAKSDLSKVLKIWEGLGYYSRARNLHRASKIILNHFKGKIPDHLTDLLNLPGIGKYTAGAILSIAYNKEAPILDGNVKRVLSRLFVVSNANTSNSLSLRGGKRLRGKAEANPEIPRSARNKLRNPNKNEIATPFGLAMTCKNDECACIRNPARGTSEHLLWHLSECLIPKGFASSFNQAIMDLGAMICTPKDPLCYRCPLHRHCKAKASGNPERYPSRVVKKRIPHIEAISAVILRNGKVLLKQRPPKGLLGGLWEFPNWRSEESGRLRFRLRNHIKKEMGMNVEVKESLGTFHQTYSHFKLTLSVFSCEAIDGRGKGKWVAVRNLHLLPMSRVDRRIAEAIQLSRMSLRGAIAIARRNRSKPGDSSRRSEQAPQSREIASLRSQ
jgi:A/G-specific adenine glycosylase